MQRKLNAATRHLEMEFPFFLTKKAPVTGRESVMDYTARFDASACGKDIDFVLTVKAGVTTLCPCSKAISSYGAHNQRGEVSVQIRSTQGHLDRGSDRADRKLGQFRTLSLLKAGG